MKKFKKCNKPKELKNKIKNLILKENFLNPNIYERIKFLN